VAGLKKKNKNLTGGSGAVEGYPEGGLGQLTKKDETLLNKKVKGGEVKKVDSEVGDH